MIKILRILKFSLTWVLLCNPALAQSYKAPAFINKDRKEKISQHFSFIDQLFEKYAKDNNFPALVYGIVLDGELVHTWSTGLSNIDANIKADSKSAFRIASMTKSITALAILKLRDEGKLRLDDKAEVYVPEMKRITYLTKDAPPITIRHLLTHAAGFPEDNPWGDRQLADSDEELLNVYENGVAFSNVPGVKYEYSNLGFATLGIIIKKITGQSYEQYITENILKPLGMHDTYWEYQDIPVSKLVQGYSYHDGKFIPEPLLHDGSYGAMGGLISTVEDFSKYIAFQLSAWPVRNDDETGPVKRSSVREMQHPWNVSVFNPGAKKSNGEVCPVVSAYGYGLAWIKDCNQIVTIAHSGGLPGFGSQWRILPDYGIGIVSFANLTYASMGRINAQALDTLLALSGIQPRQLPASAILQQRKDELIKVLPAWDNAQVSGIFAENFFLDNSIVQLKNESATAFEKARKILSASEMVAENQLRGYFILQGEKANIRISFTLTPEPTPLIQAYHLELIKKPEN